MNYILLINIKGLIIIFVSMFFLLIYFDFNIYLFFSIKFYYH